jgi:hypothetical protein
MFVSPHQRGNGFSDEQSVTNKSNMHSLRAFSSRFPYIRNNELLNSDISPRCDVVQTLTLGKAFSAATQGRKFTFCEMVGERKAWFPAGVVSLAFS